MTLLGKEITAGVLPTTIEDVLLLPLKEIAAQGGPVLHVLRQDSPLFRGFGEVYCSCVEPGAVKAWKRHKRQTQLFAVPCGLIKIVLHDLRQGSPSHGTLLSIMLGRPGHYQLLQIPPGVWYGFSACGTQEAVIVNCTDMPHDQAESERLPAHSPLIPYSWPEKN